MNGKFLRAIRVEADVSRRELASKLGITPVYFCLVETNRCAVSIEQAIRIGAALGVGFEEMMKKIKNNLDNEEAASTINPEGENTPMEKIAPIPHTLPPSTGCGAFKIAGDAQGLGGCPLYSR